MNVRMLAPILALTTAFPALAQEPAPPKGTQLDLSVEGEVTRAPDIVTIAAGVVTQAATANAAMSQNAMRMASTIAALRAAGVADRDIQTSAINLSPRYRYADNQPPTITGYQASNRVSVKFRDIKRAGAVLDALVAAGANQIDGPNFAVENADAALDEARHQAVAKARARAELYANAAGLGVKRIIAIRESGGGYQPPRPMPMMAMARAEKADTVIEPGEQKLSVSLAVSFELE
ncbi:MAG TPA: SIMPL domain-containing protein [Sphingomonadaceae bacterium]|nr:SIMPL domain-containing protein [Sphingomonadaceae bacterium]